MIGRNLGSYRIVGKMQDGGRAPLYLGTDLSGDRPVCIKVLPEHLSQDPFDRRRFEINARAIARFKHNHVLPIYDYGEENDVAYIVMPYIPTGNLAVVIQKGSLPLDEVGRILNQMAQALDHGHILGILHTELKPTNVLVDSDDNTYMMDFGISKLIRETADIPVDFVPRSLA